MGVTIACLTLLTLLGIWSLKAITVDVEYKGKLTDVLPKPIIVVCVLYTVIMFLTTIYVATIYVSMNP